MQTVAHRGFSSATLCIFVDNGSAQDCVFSKKAGVRRPRLSSWLCARIKIEIWLLHAASDHNRSADRRLSAPPWTNCQIPHLRENARHLHSVQLGEIGHHLGDELIFHQLTHFFLPIPFPTGKQIRNADL